MAAERMGRMGRRQVALKDIAERLRRGATALRAVAARDNDFYEQVGALTCTHTDMHHALTC